MSEHVKDAARFYIQRGWAIVPLAPGTKRAPDEGWTTLVFQPSDLADDDNVGIKTGAPSQGLIDIDLDAMEAVRVAPALLPKTGMLHGRASKPASHYWYQCPAAEKTLKWKDIDDASLIELRVNNAQTMVPPSVHPSGERLGWVQEHLEPAEGDLEALKRAATLVASAALIARHYPGSGSRHEFALACAGTLLRCHLTADEAQCVLGEAAKAAGDDEWRDRARAVADTATKFREEGENAALTAGKRLAELFGQSGEAVVRRLKGWWLGDAAKKSESLIDTLNEKHAVVFQQSGDVIVITEDYDDLLGRHFLRYSSFADIMKLYPDRVVVGAKSNGEPIQKSLGSYWLEHPKRRKFNGLEFRPTGGREDYYNLWRGFLVAPEPGDWSRMREHLFEVVCDGEQHIYDYVFGWMAACVQYPGRPGETAIALRGGQGAGKGVFVRNFGRIFGQHFVHLDSSRHLTGNFNAHLHDAVVVFADEAAWPGDKAGVGTLKRIITEPTLSIERKGVDIFTVPNVIHLLLASNEAWVVPAGLDDRRFCVLDVSNRRAQDHSYFQKLTDQMKAGGTAAMLHDLLAVDLTQVNLRRPPQTAALFEQKRLSMDPQQRWWLDKLEEGRLLNGHDGWAVRINKEELHNDYIESLGKMGVGRRASKTELGMLLRKLLPEGYPRQKRTLHESGGSDRMWELPSLRECRAHFAKMVKWEREWADEMAEATDPRDGDHRGDVQSHDVGGLD